MMSLFNYLKKNYIKVIGWGTGGYYKEYSQKLDIPIDFLVDSDLEKRGKIIDGYLVKEPELLKSEKPEETIIILFSSYVNEINKQVKKYGNFYTITADQLLRFSKYINQSDEKFQIDSHSNKGIVFTISRNNFGIYSANNIATVGGTSKFILEQLKVFNTEGLDNYHLTWEEFNLKSYQGIYLSIYKNGQEYSIYKDNIDFIKYFKNVKGIIIHNLIGMHLEYLDDLLSNIDKSIPIIYYLHDFSCICSNIKLMFNDDYFCKAYEEEWNLCSTCQSGPEKQYIYEYHKRLFSKDNIILVAPSMSTKKIVKTAFNLSDKKFTIIPHQTYEVSKKKQIRENNKIKIAYVGYKHSHKGWKIFKQLSEDYQDEYELYCFGYSDEVLKGVKYVSVSFLEDGEMAMTKKLLEYNIDISLLWSVWPETYSYTYFESLAAGTYVFTYKESGNIADQVRQNGNGIVFNNYDELKYLLDNKGILRSLLQRNDKIAQNLKSNYDAFLHLLKCRTE